MATREYGKVAPQFWTGETGRRLRAHGRDAQLLALYLVTNRHATMIGLYYLPLPLVAHEMGFTADEVDTALGALVAAEFCQYDHERELVWVCEMARFQVDEQLSPRDKRVAHIRALLAEHQASPLRRGFEARYQEVFHLTEGPSKEHPRGTDAPSKGLRCPSEGASEHGQQVQEAPSKPESRNREQEQRTDDDHALAREAASSSSLSPVDLHGWRVAALELLELWRAHGPTGEAPAFDGLTPKSRSRLREALALRSIDQWEATFRRVMRSDYLAGRGELPAISLWRCLEMVDRIDAGEFDPRPQLVPAPGAGPQLPVWTAEDDARVLEEQREAAEVLAARKARGELPLSEQLRRKREVAQA